MPFLLWYKVVAEDDAKMVWSKAQEYGGFDVQADYLALLMGRAQAGDSLDHERALAFNITQKLARIAESLSRGIAPSEDSWRDLGCYSMIVRRLRIAKSWPA